MARSPFAGWSTRRAAANLHTAQEAFRVLRSNLLVAIAELDNPAIVITSAAENEGKTSTSVAIAQSMAANGSRVILVDLDLRDPDAHRLLDGHNGFGVSDVLLGQMTVEESLQRIVVRVGDRGQTADLQLLAAGPATENPTELLSSPRMGEMLDALAARADIVFLDTAPVLSVADTLVIGRRAAGAVLVVEARQTPLPTVKRAKDALVRNQMRLLGVVLNKFDPKFADDDFDIAGLGYGSDTGIHRRASASASLPASSVPSKHRDVSDRRSGRRPRGWLMVASAIVVLAAAVGIAFGVAGAGGGKAEASRTTRDGIGATEPTSTVAVAPPKPAVDGVGDALVPIDWPGGERRTTIVYAVHDGSSDFALAAGEDRLVTTDGPYKGTLLLVDTSADAIRVSADGPWHLEFRSVREARSWDGVARIASGDSVVVYRGGGGTLTLQCSRTQRFLVRTGTIDGGSTRTIVDQVGPYEGRTAIPAGPVVVAVHADADAYWGTAVAG
jgi:capsular exopolysaccharide synthesis family protein